MTKLGGGSCPPPAPYAYSCELVVDSFLYFVFKVDQGECVKLSDIGIICQNDVTERSMIYAAPEVLHNCHYSAAGDVYTLGLVFWEMWYGSQVFSEILPLQKRDFVERVDVQGYRPRHQECKFILQDVQSLLHYCWAAKEEMRTTASRCYSFLLKILRTTNIQADNDN